MAGLANIIATGSGNIFKLFSIVVVVNLSRNGLRSNKKEKIYSGNSTVISFSSR